MPHIIENSTRLYPNKEAFRCGVEVLTYADLNTKTNQLAKILMDLGINKGDRVGIYMNRCIETSVAIYGIMKSGAVYVPLDSGAPHSRTRFLIKDCDIEILITTPKQKRRVSKLLEEKSNLRNTIGLSEDVSVSNISWEMVYSIIPDMVNTPNILGDDLAYIMYTSGSTGAPKGIMHSHKSGLAYAYLSSNLYEISAKDRVANHAPIHFDISTFGYFSAPLKGATTIIATDAHTKLPVSLMKLISEEKISIWYSVPLALSQIWLSGALNEYDVRSLRWVLFGGENFTIKHLKKLMKSWPQAKFSNVYGPAEVNQCTYYHFDSHTKLGNYVPIGKVWGNTEYKILNSSDGEVAKGESGQLVIRSATMMQGYWKNKYLTSKSLINISHDDNLEKTYYRTGDLVKLNKNDELVFLGRTDRQVKLRGYRIELDEIEVVLERHNDIKEATTCIITKNAGEQILVAAVILMSSTSIKENELMAHCKALLPQYAVPAKIDIMNEFPRTSSGKIDLTLIKDKLMTL